jgi:hypothetical protein
MSRVSFSDQQLINELKSGREHLLSGASPLLSELQKRLGSTIRNIFILRWIPEQGEDLYDILVDGVIVVHIEMRRGIQATVDTSQVRPVEEYLKARKHLTRRERRKLDLALQLAAAEKAD